MQISYFHTSECVPAVRPVAEGGPDAAVVIDVLRATTTIAWSLQNGAEAIQAFADLESLEASAAAWPAERRLRAGERGGKRDRKSTRLNSSHVSESRMPSSA